MATVNQYLTYEAGSVLGLPQRLVVRYVSTDPFGLFANQESAFATTAVPLVWCGFSFISDVPPHIDILEGRFPAVVAMDADSPVEVLVYAELAMELGLQLGEEFITYTRERSEEGVVRDVQINVRTISVWKERDPQDLFWFFNPRSLSERLLVPEETFVGRISNTVKGEVYTAIWYLVMDGAEIHHSEANALLRRTMGIQQQAAGYLAHTKTLQKSDGCAL